MHIVRPVHPDEYSAVADLTVAAYAPSGMTAGHPYWERLRAVEERAEGNDVWVAADEGRVLGTVTWCPPGASAREIAADGEGEFRMLAVDPDAQGRGVGRLLVTAVVDRARAENLDAVVLSTAPWMTSAHRLYESLGFVRTPARDWAVGPVLLLTYRLELAGRR